MKNVKTIKQQALHQAIRRAKQRQPVNIEKPMATKKRWFWRITKPLGRLARKLWSDDYDRPPYHDFTKGRL